MAEQEAKQRRPFHESVVDAIRRVSVDSLVCLAELIKATNIPKGHDEIIAAWNQRTQELGGWPIMDLGVPADLLEQKQGAEKKEEEKKAKQ